MTKGADGTTRVVTQPTIVPKPNQSGEGASGSKPTAQKEGPQKVQIIRGPDGKLTVRGLLAGQQLIQMPDGKLHVVMAGQQGPSGQLVAATTTAAKATPPEPVTPRVDNSDRAIAHSAAAVETATTLAPQRVASQQPQQILVQGTRQLLVQPTQQVLVQSGPRTTIQPRLQAVQTVLVPGQILQRQILQSPSPSVRPTPVAVAPSPSPSPLRNNAPRPRPPMSQQIVVNNPVLAQQIAAGKIQLATVNGQQVLIRPTGNNQAQIVAHIGASPATSTPAPTPRAVPSVASPAPAPSPASAPAPATALAPAPASTPALTEDQLMERRLLAGQPPGTVIKTVTAQVSTNASREDRYNKKLQTQRRTYFYL